MQDTNDSVDDFERHGTMRDTEYFEIRQLLLIFSFEFDKPKTVLYRVNEIKFRTLAEISEKIRLSSSTLEQKLVTLSLIKAFNTINHSHLLMKNELYSAREFLLT